MGARNCQASVPQLVLIVRGIQVVTSYRGSMSRKQDILSRFGQRLRKLRLEAGLSQEAFAAKCGLDRTYVGGIERGERNVSLRNIEVLAKSLGVTVSVLTEGL